MEAHMKYKALKNLKLAKGKIVLAGMIFDMPVNEELEQAGLIVRLEQDQKKKENKDEK